MPFFHKFYFSSKLVFIVHDATCFFFLFFIRMSPAKIDLKLKIVMSDVTFVGLQYPIDEQNKRWGFMKFK